MTINLFSSESCIAPYRIISYPKKKRLGQTLSIRIRQVNQSQTKIIIRLGGLTQLSGNPINPDPYRNVQVRLQFGLSG